MSRLARLATVGLLALAACSNGADVKSTSGPSESRPQPTRAPTTTFAGATTPVSTPRTEYRFLTAVRVGAHEGFDRVVFEFESGVPGYSVSYVNRPITEDGSGKEVTVAGGAVLAVRLESSSAVDTTGTSLRQTYTGPTRIAASGPVVTEVVRTGDFEGVLNWVIGARSQAPFHAYTSEGNKLVVDIGATTT